MGTSWLNDQTETDGISHTEWNDMVTCILNISGDAQIGSSNASITKSWYDASSSKLSQFTLSGDEWSLGYNWYNASSSKISEFMLSGTEYSLAYNWCSESSSRISQYLASGDEYSNAYAWYSNSSSKISSFMLSGDEWSTHINSDGTDHTYIDQDVTNGSAPIFSVENMTDGGTNVVVDTTEQTNWSSAYSWYSASSSKISEYITSSDIFNHELYVPSSVALSKFAESSAINTKVDSKLDSTAGSGAFYPSSLGAALMAFSSNATSLYLPSNTTRYGWANVADEETFAHNCGSKPSWVGISPSGANPIAYSFTVDATDVTVYHTSPDSESFSWRAIV